MGRVTSENKQKLEQTNVEVATKANWKLILKPNLF
jgi:hypothetical protein